MNVFVIGTPGSGKSSIINIILNEDVCKSGQTFKSRGLTQTIQRCNMKLSISSRIGKYIIRCIECFMLKVITIQCT